METPYYKHLDVPGFESVIPKLQEFVRQQGFLEKGTFFNPMKATVLDSVVPEIRAMVEMLDINDYYGLAVIRVLPSSTAPNFPHTDVMPDKNQRVAINLPVFNYKDTYTTFYNVKPNATPERVVLENGMPYERYQYDQVDEVARLKIDRPTVIRYDKLHAVVNNTDQTRITISLRFKTNPWHLFGEQYVGYDGR